MTQIRCLATEVQKDAWWCQLQVDRAAEATFQAEIQGADDLLIRHEFFFIESFFQVWKLEEVTGG